jgi:hypothetical protein
VNYSKKSIFLYDKKCRTVLQLGVLYKNLSKAATNAINLDKITKKIQSMIDKNQIYLRDVGPIILGITKIVVKKTFFLYKDIEELTNLRINVRESKRIYDNKDSEDNSEIKKMGSKKLLENDKEGTLAMNINSLDTDGLNYQNNSLANNGSELRNKLRAGNKYNNELTFSKDIIEITNDDMVNRTIQKMSRLENSDIKELISTNKKNKNDTNKFDTENKNSKTLKKYEEINTVTYEEDYSQGTLCTDSIYFNNKKKTDDFKFILTNALIWTIHLKEGGVIGFNYPTIFKPQYQNSIFLENLKKSNLIQNQIFFYSIYKRR